MGVKFGMWVILKGRRNGAVGAWVKALSSSFIVVAFPLPVTSNLFKNDNKEITWTLVKNLKIEERILFSNHIKYMPILKSFFTVCCL